MKNNKHCIKKTLVVYIVRCSKSGIIGDSAPCFDCYEKMKDYGIKKLIFSSGKGVDGKGEYLKMRFRDYKPRQKSLGRFYIELGFKQIHRDHSTNTIHDIDGKIISNSYILKELE